MPTLASLIAAEYAFASSSPQLGTRGAFLAYLAADAILFRPRPVRGKDWLTAQPARPGLLTWYPSWAYMARAGDLGCTTGPWEFRPNGPADAPIAHGYFTSMWRVQANGEWKVELDCGISCPPPAAPIEPLRPEAVNEPPSDAAAAGDVDSISAMLMALDRSLAAAIEQEGLVAGYDRFVTEQTRVYREDAWPFVGRESIRAGLKTRAGSITWQPSEARLSRSGDLGYVYGLAKLTPADGQLIESCYWRVWQQVGGAWRVLMDVDNPIQ